MKFMLDTNTCIALVKREPLQVWQRFEALSAGDVGISWVTMTELEFGVAKSQHQEKNQAALDEFVLPLETAPMDIDTARCYGQVRARLQAQGTPIGPMDLMIGVHALTLGVTSVTNNVGAFSRIEGLAIVDWLSA